MQTREGKLSVTVLSGISKLPLEQSMDNGGEGSLCSSRGFHVVDEMFVGEEVKAKFQFLWALGFWCST